MATKKQFNLFQKLLYFINSIVATVLLLSYFLAFVSPKTVPVFSVASLAVPFLIVLNFAFLIYWIIKLKKHFILSGVVLLFGWLFFPPFIKFSKKKIALNSDVKIMSYNVRMFNVYEWIKEDGVDRKIMTFINEKEPDIIALQEYCNTEKVTFKHPYKYVVPKSKKNNFGLAIFSKYKIINKGSLDFKNSANNAIFVDIIKNKDTVRIYNLHLQSLKLNPQKENFGEVNSEKLIDRLKTGFIKQASQVETFLAHEKKWKGKKVICGDFNNTSYSWVYRQIAKNKKDAFEVAGGGLGKTFNYFFPIRIDFILTDENTKIHNFKTYSEKLSDHFPIMSRINFE
ncbi:endonuclease/exonuclease/phosphatase family protein [Tenacibaculum sp. MEBiC06402]|uniref:endonuclease/exonuclease/phosphatase family protein n=1 Tax=unclassified Tenacibaculum TaxID=2635139 RepID=UPI003B9D8EFC